MVSPRRYVQSAFTLVELAIVLVIIGLLVGGVLAGADLINSAKLNSIIRDKDSYDAAALTFRDKYYCLPGDCSKAQNYFGAATAPCPGPWNGSTTCNGDGDGNICVYVGYAYWQMAGCSEALWFWQHLGAAGLVQGSYTGTTLGTGTGRLGAMGINIPGSNSYSNAGFSMYSFDKGIFFTGQPPSRDVFMFGAENPTSGGSDYTTMAGNVVLSPNDTASLDQKVDDGKPSTGSMVGAQPYGIGTGCTNNRVYPTATYINSNTPGCILLFKSSF